MKRLNFLRKAVWILFSGLVICLLTAASFLVAPAGVLYAGDNAPRPRAAPTQRGENLDQLLHNWYLREQVWLSAQQNHLDRANQLATKLQTYITKQQGQGKDTASLQAALTTFQQQVGTAQSAHDTAASTLSTHAGFDANGQVTDTSQARQTIVSARQSMYDAHLDLKQAVVDLHNAFRQWREANK
jgi:hypothetical protein